MPEEALAGLERDVQQGQAIEVEQIEDLVGDRGGGARPHASPLRLALATAGARLRPPIPVRSWSAEKLGRPGVGATTSPSTTASRASIHDAVRQLGK
jgi:hypothetical protein